MGAAADSGRAGALGGAAEHPAELRLALPGLLHSLGNALFTIQGHGHRVGSSTPDLEAEKAAILRGAARAQDALEVLGHLAGDPAPRPVQAGILLHRLAEVLKVPLRERGMQLVLEHSCRQTPESVDGRVLCRAVTATLVSLLRELPGAVCGRITVDLCHQTREHLELRIGVVPDQSMLPFPLRLDRVVRSVGPRLGDLGVGVSGPDGAGRLQLRISGSGAGHPSL